MNSTQALSHVVGSTDVPLIEKTIGAYFDEIVARYPQQPALIVNHQNIRYNYAQLQEQVNNLAVQLHKLGLNKGDRIGIWSHNCAEWVLTQFATAKLGLILVNINPAYRSTELSFALKSVGCKALILAPHFKTSHYVDILGSLAPEIASTPAGQQLNLKNLPDLKIAIHLGTETFAGLIPFDTLLVPSTEDELAELDFIQSQLSPTDPINIQFTSGTTGLPKGATLSHRNIINNGYYIGESMRLTPDDKLCIPVPLYHCFGMVLGNLACVSHGAAMVYPSEAFNPQDVLETVQKERCTALHGVPTMFIAILDLPNFADYRLDSLRTGIMAGSPCPTEVMKKVIARMHMSEVTIAYGMTETSPVSFQSAVDDPIDVRVSTVGRIQPHIEAKIVNEQGETVPCGEKGEILVKGYCVMSKYWNGALQTEAAIDADGWMHTGDLGVLDEHGYCTITGRAKDVVIRGGENIYPREVEEYLYQHPKIQDVQCVGVPDVKFGEELCACVVVRAGETCTEEEVRGFCRGQIAHYKVPRYVCFVDEFPMTITGKIQKYILRDMMAKELGLASERADD